MRRTGWGKRAGTILLACITAAGLMACGSADTATTAAAKAATEQKAAAPAAGNSAPVKGSVTAAGSSALLPLAKAAAEDFMKKNPDCTIAVNGGGSGTGLKQAADGSVDIGNSDVFAEEKLDAAAAGSLKDHEVCTVTMAAVVNKSLGIKSLTTQQLTDVFTGKVTNWKDVGGPDKPVTLVTRPASSGTRALFKKWAIGGAEEASNAALETDDSGTLLQTVEDNDGSIGYVALSYLVNNDKVQPVAIDGVDATLENTYSGKYKVWGFEHMYTKGDGSDAAKAFITFMTGDEFAKKIEAMGYGVASKMSADAVSSHK